MIDQHHTLISLGPDEIHVWHFGLNLPFENIVELQRLLTPDELSRTDFLHGQELHNRFVAGRGLMRRILSRYAGKQPKAIAFTHGPYGKPFLLNLHSSLEFNLSHSGDRALLAVAQQPVGIDLEHIRVDLDIEAIATTVFSSQELAALRALPERDRLRVFFTTWVRKEACMKATGRGLHEPPGGFTVVADDAGLSVRMSRTSQTGETLPWRVYDLAAGLECVAALAVAGSRRHRILSFNLVEHESVCMEAQTSAFFRPLHSH